ncbi:hypothetical protein J005_06382 [Cryptococcus neoformans]|nr:hypothetical protein C344_06243 [Cryptococcus neoformans var. grubii AD1-7a]OXH23453.1 hypothetical protein J005_06382 [Cryptococcus neoformans var. grubii]
MPSFTVWGPSTIGHTAMLIGSTTAAKCEITMGGEDRKDLRLDRSLSEWTCKGLR